jgi:indolepyruvate ferredoxin oxidoreductase beta subunit
MNGDKSINVVMCGVGGQGIVLASRILSEVAVSTGNQVYCTESHGMAQRGGSVVAHIRIGRRVHSGLIPLGEGDLLIGFEPIEAVRSLPYIREGGSAVINSYKIPTVMKTVPYPEIDMVEGFIRDHIKKAYFLDATSLAKPINPRSVNMVMLGAATKIALPFSKKEVLDA